MSGSQTPPGPTSGSNPAADAASAAGSVAAVGSDPSMEDILASIRRILSEDEGQAVGINPPARPVVPSVGAGSSDGVLVLDAASMVPAPPHSAAPAAELTQLPEIVQPDAGTAAPGLVAPEAAAAAASSVGSLLRAIATEREMQVRGGGPTIEDIVREELRPLLKSWLDANLPVLVERLVRAEIERVVSRAVP